MRRCGVFRGTGSQQGKITTACEHPGVFAGWDMTGLMTEWSEGNLNLHLPGRCNLRMVRWCWAVRRVAWSCVEIEGQGDPRFGNRCILGSGIVCKRILDRKGFANCYCSNIFHEIHNRHINDKILERQHTVRVDARLATISHDLLGWDKASHQWASPKLKSLERDGGKEFYPAMYWNGILLILLNQIISAGTMW
jgi:hypothetical protein